MILSATPLFTYTDPPTAVATAAVGTDAYSDTVTGVQALLVRFNGADSAADAITPSPGAGITDYHWLFADGTTVSGPTNAVPTHVFYPFGTFVVTLTVTDTFGQTDSDTVTVTVTEDTVNFAPDAIITALPTDGPAPLSVAFNASNSTEWADIVPGGRIEWDFGDGGTSRSINPVHTFSPHGPGTTNYTVTLVVTNIYGKSDVDTLVIPVGFTEIPIPEITSISPQEGQESGGTSILVKGTGLITVDTAWFYPDGLGSPVEADVRAFSDDAITVISPPGIGVWYLVLTSYAGSSPHPLTRTQFTYVPGPTANATVSSGGGYGPVANGLPGTTFSFSSSGSTSGVTYLWDFGDGTTFNLGDQNTSNEANPEHRYQQPGSFTVTLTVRDSSGVTGTDTCTVHVQGPGTGWPDGGGGSPGGPSGPGGPDGDGGPGGPPYDPPPGDPPVPLWLDSSCEITPRGGVVGSGPFSVEWASRRFSSYIQFTARVEIQDLEGVPAFAAYIGAMSASGDGGIPYPNPSVSTVSTLGYNPTTASISGGGLDYQYPARVLNGLYAPTLFPDGAIAEGVGPPAFPGGVIPYGTIINMAVKAPLTYTIAFASLGFLNFAGYNTSAVSYAWVRTECDPDVLNSGSGWVNVNSVAPAIGWHSGIRVSKRKRRPPT